MFQLIRYLRDYKKESIIGPLFKLLEACFELAVPLVMADMIDYGIAQSDSSYILKKGLLLFFLGTLGLTCSLTAQYFAAKAALGFGTALRNDMFSLIQSFSYTEQDKFGAPTLITRMTGDILQAQTGVNLVLRLFLRSPFIAVGAVIMAFTIDSRLTVIFLIISVLLSFIIYLIIHKNLPVFKLVQKTLDKVSLQTRENLKGVRVIRAFSRQEKEEEEFKKNCDEMNRLQQMAGRISSLMSPVTNIVVNSGIIAILYYGSFRVNSGAISQGEIIALVNYLTQILLALVALSVLIVAYTKAAASAERVNEIFDIRNKRQEQLQETSLPVPESSKNVPFISFEHVGFRYQGAETNALTDISFQAFSGETIGIIGSTGSGKTTLLNLIPRFYDITEGVILINGQDSSLSEKHQLREIIGIAPQKAVLFQGTIRSNLLWGNEQATDKDIDEAMMLAQAKEFVDKLPSGIDSPVSQGGSNFSGGQRQRLSIARALIRKSPVLLLDDCSSALDYATDARLRESLQQGKEKRVTLMISQRVVSVQNAAKILVLEEGRMAGFDTHEQLLLTCPVYQEIYRSQQ